MTVTLGSYHPVLSESVVGAGATFTFADAMNGRTVKPGPFTMSSGMLYFEPTQTTTLDVPDTTGSAQLGHAPANRQCLCCELAAIPLPTRPIITCAQCRVHCSFLIHNLSLFPWKSIAHRPIIAYAAVI